MILLQTCRSAIEDELHSVISLASAPGLDEYRAMLAYHLGWEGEGAGQEARGKRIRPMLVVLSCAAAGGVWQNALPAAAAVELLHNFSLIHDDIQDNSPLRRGRPTVWKKWGVPQAINAGDAMFTLAHLALLRLKEIIPLPEAILAMRILQETCLHLTQGQYLDMAYEKRDDLTLQDYWPMVNGKTAALFSACTELGALIAGTAPATRSAYGEFGRLLGLAFQVEDDLLGIWGDAALTGKSAESDLMTGKKSLPVLFGLEQGGKFAKRWRGEPLIVEEIPLLAAQLEAEGGRAFTEKTASDLTAQALRMLDSTHPGGEAGQNLRGLMADLVGRQG
jgi:geranylgeranyl diphosphate synthase type I